MNSYSSLLSRGAEEVSSFVSQNQPQSPPRSVWQNLANMMLHAASQSDDEKAEKIIDIISRNIVDAFPLNLVFAPSFEKALDGLQRKRKRNR